MITPAPAVGSGSRPMAIRTGNTAAVNAISKTDTKEENTDEYSGK